jgi:hypothetical protein
MTPQAHAYRVLFFTPAGVFLNSEYLESETLHEARQAIASVTHDGRAELWCGADRIGTLVCGNRAPSR